MTRKARAVRTQDVAPYAAKALSDDDITIAAALAILQRRVASGPVLASPGAVRDYLAVRFANLEHEVFTILYVSADNHLIEVEELFRGTLTQTSVYPREVVKGALARNAAGVILTHNHPSGNPEVSHADQSLTRELKAALKMVDVHVLDHIVTAGGTSTSFAEKGLL